MAGGRVRLAPVLIGIDSGQTVGKVVAFDLDGVPVASAAAPTRTSTPHPRWMERDMDRLWDQVVAALRSVLDQLGPAPVLGIGVGGHNDGAYPVDADLRPVRPAILATDSRATAQAQALFAGPDGARALEITGQAPFAAAPSALYRWLREEEPEHYAQVRWALFCKDWLRLRLTGTVATDPTEASASFTDLRAGGWSDEALALYDLTDLRARLPPVRDSTEVAGAVTDEVAAATGLPPGTPVVVGAHDVDCAALGVGATAPGAASVQLGTFSINQVVADRAVTGPLWQCRPFLVPGRWLHMSTSPAGTSNLDWALARLSGPVDPGIALAQTFSATVTEDVPRFVPYLYGAPHGHDVGGAWVGVRGWHARPELLYAVAEGVVFNHRAHLDPLRTELGIAGPVRLSGGGARSSDWTQLLCDTLDLPVEVTRAQEAGALGAALLAGIGVGAYPSLDDAVARAVRVVRRQRPEPQRVARLATRYRGWTGLVQALTGAAS